MTVFAPEKEKQNLRTSAEPAGETSCPPGCNGCSTIDEEGIIHRIPFTKEMKETYRILVPNMLPMHFEMICKIFDHYGYTSEVLTDGSHGDSRTVIDKGLKYVHNDTCYPALLIIGQFLTALDSGRYDTHKVALLLSQTGGGCRASNYIPLLRKALIKAGYGYIPVISFNLAGLEENPGFKLTLPILHRLAYGMIYADLIMLLRNQCKPYEIHAGDSDRMADKWTEILTNEMAEAKVIRYGRVKKNYVRVLDAFASIPMQPRDAVKVGVVGEIYIKFSPLGNNNLEDFLNAEGAEVVKGGLVDFCIFCVYNGIMDNRLYGLHRRTGWVYRLIYRFLCKKQMDLIRTIERHGRFAPPPYFDHMKDLVQGVIGYGAKMGEGWLLTAELLDHIESGIENVVCVQPFGCLPNHIVGKGKMRQVKEAHLEANIIAVDYDPSATRINQENRLKLMLANAKKTPVRGNTFVTGKPEKR